MGERRGSADMRQASWVRQFHTTAILRGQTTLCTRRESAVESFLKGGLFAKGVGRTDGPGVGGDGKARRSPRQRANSRPPNRGRARKTPPTNRETSLPNGEGLCENPFCPDQEGVSNKNACRPVARKIT